MAKRYLATAVLVVAFLAPGVSAAGDHGAAGSHGAHWGYGIQNGPQHWGEMEKGFESCKLGKLQTPIDIKTAKKAKKPALIFDYKSVPLTVVDNGHTLQAKMPPGSTLRVGDAKYELVQFHFHKPSEEKLQGKAAAMDVHLVHKNAEGKLAVVGVLLDPGTTNPVLEAVLQAAPKGEGESSPKGVTVDPSKLLPAKRTYYTFTGSLTTPPCTEGVTWFVFKNPTQIGKDQVALFAKRYPNNARPVQPVNGRVVEEVE